MSESTDWSKSHNGIFLCGFDRSIELMPEVEKILNAYLLMEEIPYNIRILAGTDNIVGYKDEIIMIREKKIQEKVEKMHSSYLPKINDAIYSIENQLNS